MAILVTIFFIYRKEIRFAPVRVSIYKQLSTWGLSVILVLIAKINFYQTNKTVFIIICGIALIFSLGFGKYDSES